jgi:hypothetical protein
MALSLRILFTPRHGAQANFRHCEAGAAKRTVFHGKDSEQI